MFQTVKAQVFWVVARISPFRIPAYVLCIYCFWCVWCLGLVTLTPQVYQIFLKS
jgi:hypothetical protein